MLHPKRSSKKCGSAVDEFTSELMENSRCARRFGGELENLHNCVQSSALVMTDCYFLLVDGVMELKPEVKCRQR